MPLSLLIINYYYCYYSYFLSTFLRLIFTTMFYLKKEKTFDEFHKNISLFARETRRIDVSRRTTTTTPTATTTTTMRLMGCMIGHSTIGDEEREQRKVPLFLSIPFCHFYQWKERIKLFAANVMIGTVIVRVNIGW